MWAIIIEYITFSLNRIWPHPTYVLLRNSFSEDTVSPKKNVHTDTPQILQIILENSITLWVPDWKTSCGITQGFTSKHPKTFTVSQIEILPHIWDYLIFNHFLCTLISLFPLQWKTSTWLITFRASNILINNWTVHNLWVKKWKSVLPSRLQSSNARAG